MTTSLQMNEEQPRVGVVTFTDDRPNIFSREHELGLEQKHKELRAFLESEGFCVVDVMERLRGPASVDWFGVHNPAEVRAAADYLREGHAECLIIIACQGGRVRHARKPARRGSRGDRSALSAARARGTGSGGVLSFDDGDRPGRCGTGAHRSRSRGRPQHRQPGRGHYGHR